MVSSVLKCLINSWLAVSIHAAFVAFCLEQYCGRWDLKAVLIQWYTLPVHVLFYRVLAL